MDITRFLDYVRLQKRYSDHSVRAYENDLNGFSLYLRRQYEITEDWPRVTHLMIRGYILELMEEGLEASSVTRKISALRSFFKYLLKQGVVKLNPMDRVTAPKKGKKLLRVVEEDDLHKLLDEIVFDQEQDRLMVETFYQTGMRSAELIGLCWGDFDPGEGSLKVLGKRNKERKIPLTPAFVQRLTDYKKRLDGAVPATPIFVTSKGEKLYPKLVYKVVNTYLSLVSGVEKKSPHILRHSFATHMLNRGADLNAIKEILGHSNLSATQVYTHNSIDKLKRTYNQAHPRGPKKP
jgi:integrase/recombinase XerC